jgi:hypothetical protein
VFCCFTDKFSNKTKKKKKKERKWWKVEEKEECGGWRVPSLSLDYVLLMLPFSPKISILFSFFLRATDLSSPGPFI